MTITAEKKQKIKEVLGPEDVANIQTILRSLTSELDEAKKELSEINKKKLKLLTS